MYPKAWDLEELVFAKALDTGPVRASDLKNNLHKIFLPERWRVTREEYEALLPSMRLASRLIEVSMPYLSNFLPSDQIHQDLTPRMRNADGSYSGYTISLRESVLAEDLQQTRVELDTIANTIFWQVNYEMYRTLSWIGITRTVYDGPRPWGEIAPEETMSNDDDLKTRGFTRRPLTIGIMGEYVIALRQFPPDSEAHLRATFLAAITMIHEIGHAVFHQDFRSLDYDPNYGYEPWVGNDRLAELGLSYIGWIFGGYNPNTCAIGSVDHPWSFKDPLAWYKQFTIDEQPLYETAYSVGIQYMEEVLSTDFWNSLGDPNAAEFSKNARRKLEPPTDSIRPKPATAMLPQWKWTRSQGVVWKIKFHDRRAEGRLEVSDAEIDWEKDQFRTRYPHRRRTLWNGRPNPRLNVLNDEDEDGDEEFEFGPPATSNTEPELYSLQEADLPPRETDDGFLQPDLLGDINQEGSCTTRLEVRYRPQKDAAPPSRKPELLSKDPDDPGKGERFAKEEYDGNDYVACLYNKANHKITEMTHDQTFKYCQTRNIRFGLEYQDNETWQLSKLDQDILGEVGLIQRIKQYSFHRLEERFKGNPRAIFRIKSFAKNINNWENQDLVEFCQVQGMRTSGNWCDRKACVQNWMEVDLDAAKVELAKYEAENPTKAAKKPLVDDDDDPRFWSEADFIAFFGSNKLPNWGTSETWIQRLIRFREEQTAGGNISRWEINQDSQGLVLRTRGDIEVYRWVANLHRTSVAGLKTAILFIGMFPSTSVLDLYFGADRQNALQDDKALSFYEGKNFRDIWLELQTSDSGDGEALPDMEEQPIVYHPPSPAKRRGPSKSTANTRTNSGKDNTDKSGPKPSLKRSYDIMEGTTAPTITERMQQIGQVASRLTQATKAGGGRELLQPHLKGRKSRSGAEMLDNLEDLEEEQEEREKALRRAITGARCTKNGNGNGLPNGDDDGYEDIPNGSGRSFMAKTYRSIMADSF